MSDELTLRFTRHALERMFQRGISPLECGEVFNQAIVLESYPDDQPLPSELRFGICNGRTLHIVVSLDTTTAHVITAYEPDLAIWDESLRSRRKK